MTKLCQFENCKNRATYGINSIPIRCITHKEIIMKASCGLCKCGKYAIYNFIGKRPAFCNYCKEDGMINVKDKKCNCGNGLKIYNYEGLKAQFCSSCKKNDMINVIHKKCNCGKAFPNYNYVNLLAKYCFDCKLDEMINVKENKCFCNKKRPCFNFDGLKPAYCSECKLDGMINVNNKKCKCGKTHLTYNYKELPAAFCSQCKNDDMVIVSSIKCKAEQCQTIGSRNYKGYCTNCFQHLFPNDPLTFQIRSKTKEIAVRDFINSKFEGFQHDKVLWYNEKSCDCTTKRRIDHRKLINGTLLCIETDENQHKSYSKTDEEARYNDLFMAYGGKFIFIRFNPDKYLDKNGKTRNPMLVNRLPVLENEINKQIKRIENFENIDLLEVIEIFYDISI
jgi:hypothetical protein